MTSEGLLEVEALSVDYGRGRAVDSVSLRVPEHGCIGLVGANGAGKTSFLRAVSGLVRAESGSVRFGEQHALGRPAWWLARRGIRLVPESRELAWGLSVHENLVLGTTGLAAHDRREAIAPVLELFPALATLARQRARLLSGGQQQMLAIGRALAGRPRLLIIDEPTQGLAPVAIRDLMAALRRLRDGGLSLLIADANLTLVRALCEEAFVLRLGVVVAHGPPTEVLSEDALREAYLGA